MTHLFVLPILTLALLSAATHARADGPLATEIQRTLQQEQLIGAVWATISPTGAVTGAAGLSDATTGTAMRADSRIHVGSVAKVLLAAGVLRLITEGKLSLDTPVATLLPALSFNNRWADTDPVRVRHLLAHTAGVENFRLWHLFSTHARADTPLAAAFSGATPDTTLLPVQARPGSRHAYSNLGYVLLGMVIERVGGQRYDRYLDAHLLQPLGMRDTTFGFVTQTGAHADTRWRWATSNAAAQATLPGYMAPAGQLTTTAADMARLAVFLMGDGGIDGRPFIAQSLMAQLGAPSGTEAARAGLSIGHGRALAGRDRHGHYGYCHPGTTIGFNAMLCVYPAQRKAFFIAINTDSETADYDRFNKLLIDALRLARPAPSAPVATPGAPADDIAQWQGIYVPALHAMRSLAWTDIVFNFMRVGWDGSALHVKPFQGKPKMLMPTGGHLFTQTGRLESSHVLLVGDDGRRILSDGIRSHARIDKTLFVALWTSLALGLLGWAYIAAVGLWRLLRRRLRARDPLFVPLMGVPLMGVLALALPAPLFYLQSFMRMGD
jgi:CubicO group peptidase (beta-lactamase class C family)